jgi:hypothetical protein
MICCAILAKMIKNTTFMKNTNPIKLQFYMLHVLTFMDHCVFVSLEKQVDYMLFASTKINIQTSSRKKYIIVITTKLHF